MNMKQIIWLCFLPVTLFTMFACKDTRMNYMVDDKVYLLNPGLNETTIFNWGDFTYNLYVIKSGKGQQGATVKLNIDEVIMQKYNTEHHSQYKLLPEDCYTVKVNSLSFNSSDYRQAFLVDLKADKIAELQKNSTETYALPCQMQVEDNSIETTGTENTISIIVPTVKEPYLELNNPGLFSPGVTLTPASDDIMFIYSKVKTNYYNQWDLSYSLEIDAKILEQYNDTAKVKYQLLPEKAYEFDKSTWVIPARKDDQYIKIQLNKKGLISGNNYQFGKYAIPIRLASVSMHKINPQCSTMLYPVILEEKETETK